MRISGMKARGGNTSCIRHPALCIFLLLAFFALTIPGLAFAESPEPDHYVDVRILPEHDPVKAGDTVTLAIEHTIYPHWHLYWINPGDSGLPIRIKWTLPEGFEIGDIIWPVPDKIFVDPLANYGYQNHVTLLQKLKVPDTLPEGSQTLHAKIDMLVCKDICVPETAELDLTLNNPAQPQTDNGNLIKEAQEKLPLPLQGTFTFGENEKKLVMRLKPEDPSFLQNVQLETAEFFPEEWGLINHFPQPRTAIEDGTLVIRHERGDVPVDKLESLKGLLTFKDKQGIYQGYSLTAAPEKIKESAAPPAISGNPSMQSAGGTKTAHHTEISSYSTALFFAFLGGLILNLMPCVFPIISMKALSLAKLSGKEQKEARAHGLSYTAGVIISFMVVGMMLVFLKTAGSAIGWGFQLQNPVVVATLAYLLFLVGLNLMGFFEIGASLGNLGNNLTNRHSMLGSFFTGTLATVVATPCMAPFMATALGYALVQSASVALSIFIALGFGLAFPYLLLCYIPAAQKILPRPGKWMNTFKQFLAFPMFGFSIWLVSILAQQSGPEGVLMTLLGMLFLSMAIWLAHFKPFCSCGIMSRTPLLICLILPVLSLYSLAEIPTANASQIAGESFGKAYSSSKLASALESKDPVFVEMTAAWCITCKVNHRLAIDIQSTRKAFSEQNVQYLVGDWTNYDKEITSYLDSFGRSGVPIYVFYGAPDTVTGKRPDPVVLPQLLTPGIVHATITRN